MRIFDRIADLRILNMKFWIKTWGCVSAFNELFYQRNWIGVSICPKCLWEWIKIKPDFFDIPWLLIEVYLTYIHWSRDLLFHGPLLINIVTYRYFSFSCYYLAFFGWMNLSSTLPASYLKSAEILISQALRIFRLNDDFGLNSCFRSEIQHHESP